MKKKKAHRKNNKQKQAKSDNRLPFPTIEPLKDLIVLSNNITEKTVFWKKQRNGEWKFDFVDDIKQCYKNTMDIYQCDFIDKNRGIMFYLNKFYLVCDPADEKLKQLARWTILKAVCVIRGWLMKRGNIQEALDIFNTDMEYLTWNEFEKFVKIWTIKLSYHYYLMKTLNQKKHPLPSYETEELMIKFNHYFVKKPPLLKEKTCGRCMKSFPRRKPMLRCPKCMSVVFCNECFFNDDSPHYKYCDLIKHYSVYKVAIGNIRDSNIAELIEDISNRSSVYNIVMDSEYITDYYGLAVDICA